MAPFFSLPLSLRAMSERKSFPVSLEKCEPFSSPVIGFSQAVHLLEKSSPKQSAQYGLSSLLVNLCPASDFWQCVQVKHSRCHGSLRYVTPPWVMTCPRDLGF